LDGYNQRPLLDGSGADPRKEFFYWTDDGNLAAVRYDRWKLLFLQQKAVGFKVWSEPLVPLRAADDIIASIKQTGEVWYEAEALRIKAMALAKKNETDAAKALLEQAIATAERQSARLWEARARIDIALLLANQQQEAAARSQLEPIRHWDETINVPERSQAETVLARLGH
jgi:hypothetical protein